MTTLSGRGAAASGIVKIFTKRSPPRPDMVSREAALTGDGYRDCQEIASLRSGRWRRP